MKRVCVLLSMFFLTAGTSSARVYVGGMLGLNTVSDNIYVLRKPKAENSNWFIKPEAGYSFNEHFALGAQVGYFSYSRAGITDFTISPYLRYTVLQLPHFGVFLDALYEYDYRCRLEQIDVNGFPFLQPSYQNYNKAALAAGVSIPVSDNFGITMRVASYGYDSGKEGAIWGLSLYSASKVSLYWYL